MNSLPMKSLPMKSLAAGVLLVVGLLLLALFSTPVKAQFLGDGHLHPNNEDPQGMAGWKTFLYIVDSDDERVYLYRQAGRAHHASYALASVNEEPRGIAISGNVMWVNDSEDKKIHRYNILSGGGISLDSAGSINLHPNNDSPAGMAVRDIGGTPYLYVVDNQDDYVYVYKTSTKGHVPSRAFDIDRGNSSPWGIWIQGDILWMGDRTDTYIRAHDLSQSGQPIVERRYIEYTPANDDSYGMWSDGDALWVIDNHDEQTYKYKLNHQRDRAADFNLRSGNRSARGMTCYPTGADLPGTTLSGPAALVYDQTDHKAYGYRLLQYSSLASSLSNLDLDFPQLNNDGWGITIDSSYVYATDRSTDSLRRYVGIPEAYFGAYFNNRFSLDSDNSTPRGIWRGSTGNMHVVDSNDSAIYLYSSAGVLSSRKPLYFLAGEAKGIWSTGNVVYVVQYRGSDRRHWLRAYRASDLAWMPELDIALTAHSRTPTGVCGVGERLWVVDSTRNNAYAYLLVRDTNVQPEFTVDTETFTIDENSVDGTVVGSAPDLEESADADDGDTAAYSISGTHAAYFKVDPWTGEITVGDHADGLDFETTPTMSVILEVRDKRAANFDDDTAVDDTVAVTISLNNLPEAGSLAIDVPNSGIALTLITISTTLTDPDGGITAEVWQWQRRATGGSWEDIAGATNPTYEPTTADVGSTLRVQVTYTDTTGPMQLSTSRTFNVLSGNLDPTFPDDDENSGAGDGNADPIAFAIDENSPANTPVGTVAATDPNGDTLTYSVSGTDATDFQTVFALNTSSGQITVKPAGVVNFELKQQYVITVNVTDNKDSAGSADATLDDTVTVTITVNNVDDPGTVTVTAGTPTAGTAITATLSDPDGGVTGLTWQWQRSSATMFDVWEDLTGATSASYSPDAQVIARFLRAVASYTDTEGTGKTAHSAATTAVAPATGAPTFSARVVSRSVDENSVAGVAVGDPVTATDPDGDTLTYLLAGTDSGSFTINTGSGQLLVAPGANLDFETKPLYLVTVSVTDNKDSTGNANTSVDDIVVVTINIGDVDEAPAVLQTEPDDSLHFGQRYYIFYVNENFGSGSRPAMPVGTVTATQTGETITYSLAGTDADRFSVNATSGALTTMAGKALSDEPGVYRVIVTATGDGTVNAVVLIIVKRVKRTTSRNLPETYGNDREPTAINVGAPILAVTGTTTETFTFSIEHEYYGPAFQIDANTGQLKTKAGREPYNYEAVPRNLPFYVRVTDSDGVTDRIWVTVNITDRAEPPRLPGSPCATDRSQITSTSIPVSWGSGYANAGFPRNTGYDVRYRPGSSGSWINGPQHITVTRTTLTGLTPNTKYELQARARNHEGTSNWTTWQCWASYRTTLDAETSMAQSNTPAMGNPGIQGTARVGETLTATTSGITDDDGLDNAVFAYQWVRSELGAKTGTDIAGATSSTYGVTSEDEGKAITVRVTFTDDAGNQESLPSYAVVAATALPEAQVPGAPDVSAQDSTSLAVSWTEPASDGGSAITGYKVQWKEAADSWDTPADVSEAAATGTSHTITGLTGGTEYSVRVSAVNSVGDGTPSPEATGTPTAGDSARGAEGAQGTPAEGLPAVIGEPTVGETLSADNSGISDKDGMKKAVFTYQWVAGGADIDGATGASYTLTDEEEGLAIQVWVSFTDDAGNPEAVTSVGTAAVSPANTPASGVPAIIGILRDGETLTADTSGISDEDRMDNAVFTYRWMAGGTDIDGATGSIYTLTADEVGAAISVWVSFTDDAGNPEAVTSGPTEAVAPKPPLTAQFLDTPGSHDGQSEFTFELRFSETPRRGFSYQTLRDHALTVTGGEVVRARRMEKGKNLRWEITVSPDSNGAVTIVLPATTNCDAEGAICTGDGRMLSNQETLTVAGPG